jgi:hypothetical protein
MPEAPDLTGQMMGHGVYGRHSLAQHSAGGFGLPGLDRAARSAAAGPRRRTGRHRRPRCGGRSERAAADDRGHRDAARRRRLRADHGGAHGHPDQRLLRLVRDGRARPGHVPAPRRRLHPRGRSLLLRPDLPARVPHARVVRDRGALDLAHTHADPRTRLQPVRHRWGARRLPGAVGRRLAGLPRVAGRGAPARCRDGRGSEGPTRTTAAAAPRR